MRLTTKARLIMEKAIDDIITELGEEEVFATGILRHSIEKEFRSVMHDRRNAFMESQKK